MQTLVLFCLLGCVLSQDLHGPDYEKKTRFEKSQIVWNRVVADRTSNDWYNALQTAELFVESMNTSFTTRADDMPKQYIGGLYTRKKLIHTVGVVVQAALNIENFQFNYTGIFKTGSDSSLLRFSAAAKPDPSDSTNVITPGIAIKCFRDQTVSGNFFAMFSLLGQPTTNFFAHDFSNHPPDLGDWAPFALKALKSRFSTASPWPTMLGLSDLARFDKFGRLYTQPNFPYRVIFHPSAKLHTSIPDRSTNTFTTDIARAIAINDVLFTVWVQDQPNSQPQRIGSVVATSAPTVSKFGDMGLFHQHTSFESDLAIKPQWTEAAKQETAYQRATKGFNYPDLPWN